VPQGYEVVFIRDKNSGEGSFCMAFQRTADALEWFVVYRCARTCTMHAGRS
jgi:hypothetical protein